MRCCREGCDLPAIITFHDKGKDIAKCGCVIHYFDMLTQFEEESQGHPHMKYVAYCEGCKSVIPMASAIAPTMSNQPLCRVHPNRPLKLMPITGDHIFKECVWEEN